ncbi:hypothetical protein N7537_010249 [Penicillium hordei]|uniref:Uncharacterized protein n=1 Tax=Penicillium hordei TaxID=40994 RepID=A0AAD6DUA3_9EURO|nr:uncharacterized protein N7537_010249 [Penicillium hordei]KAJ5593345.1 hypothetical protein N7537_010249 [Penicillium hordei]
MSNALTRSSTMRLMRLVILFKSLSNLLNLLNLFDLSIIDRQLELRIANWGVLSESGTVGLCNEVENQQSPHLCKKLKDLKHNEEGM